MPNFLWTPLLFPNLGWQLIYQTALLSNGYKVEYSKVPIEKGPYFYREENGGFGEMTLLIKFNSF